MVEGTAVDDNEVIQALVRNFDAVHPDMVHEERPFQVYKVLRETDPVKKLDSGGLMPGSSWLLTRHRDIVNVFQNNESFSSGFGGGFGGFVTELRSKTVRR